MDTVLYSQQDFTWNYCHQKGLEEKNLLHTIFLAFFDRNDLAPSRLKYFNILTVAELNCLVKDEFRVSF